MAWAKGSRALGCRQLDRYRARRRKAQREQSKQEGESSVRGIVPGPSSSVLSPFSFCGGVTGSPGANASERDEKWDIYEKPLIMRIWTGPSQAPLSLTKLLSILPAPQRVSAAKNPGSCQCRQHAPPTPHCHLHPNSVLFPFPAHSPTPAF